MFFEKVHKVSSAVATNISQMINCQLLLIMKADVINNIPDLLFLTIAFQRLRFGDNITIFKKQIKELYGINIVKEVKKDYYTHEYISNNLTTFGSITFNGKTDDGRKITVDYDVEGDYINNWDYKY